MRLYYVNPGDTTDITELRPLPFSGTLPDGRQVSGLSEAVPEWDTYPEVDNSTPPPDEYRASSPVLTFFGDVKDPAAVVQRTTQHDPIPMDTLYFRKESELAGYTATVLTANCENTIPGGSNWVVVLDSTQRTWISSVSNFLQDRLKDITIDGEQKPYWARDVPLVFINTNTHRRFRTNVNEPQWGTVMKDIGQHDFDATDASELVQADLDTAYGDGTGEPGGPEWTALASINVQEPLYGWPPVYTPPSPGATGVRRR